MAIYTSNVVERVIAAKFGLFGKSANSEIDNFACHCSLTPCDCSQR